MTTRRSAFASPAGLEKRPQPSDEMSAAESRTMSRIRFIRSFSLRSSCGCSRSEDESQLQLERPRLVNVGERGDGVRRRADGRELAEGRVRRARVAVDRLGATEDVRAVEDVEAFEPEQDARALGRSDAGFDEERPVVDGRAAERGLADD